MIYSPESLLLCLASTSPPPTTQPPIHLFDVKVFVPVTQLSFFDKVCLDFEVGGEINTQVQYKQG